MNDAEKLGQVPDMAESNSLATIQGFVESLHPNTPASRLEEYRAYFQPCAEADKKAITERMPEDIADKTHTTSLDRAEWVEGEFKKLVGSGEGQTAALIRLMQEEEIRVQRQENEAIEKANQARKLEAKQAQLQRVKDRMEDLDGLGLDTAIQRDLIRRITVEIDDLTPKE